MARFINGLLTVPAFSATGNAGEYSFSDAVYQNQSDIEGLGVDAIIPGFILYVPASGVAGSNLIPGVAHRYRVTSVTDRNVSLAALSGVVVWDEPNPEIDQPSNGIDCIISEPSINYSFGFPASPDVYPVLAAGLSQAANNIDVENITDNMKGSSMTLGVLPGPYAQGAVSLTEGQKISDALDKINAFIATLVVPTFSSTFAAINWTVKPSETYPSIILNHGLGTSSLKVDIFEENAGFFSPAYVEWAANDTYIKMTISNTAYTAFAGKIEVRPI